MERKIELTDTHEKRATELFEEEQLDAIFTIKLQKWIDELYNQQQASKLQNGTQ